MKHKWKRLLCIGAALTLTGQVVPLQMFSGGTALVAHAADYEEYTEDGIYSFCWLRSSLDYHQAAKALHNCLDEYRPEPGGGVLVIKHGRKIRAAVEVCGHEVLQAFGPNNAPIANDPEISRVFENWLQAHQYEWCVEDWGEEFDEQAQ